jgi:hydroxypyruvate isomerase
MPGGDRSVISIPGRETEFRDSADVLAAIAVQTGCTLFNALYGVRVEHASAQQQGELAAQNLAVAAAAVASFGGTVLLEPLTEGENGAYPLTGPKQVAAVIHRVRTQAGVGNLRLLADFYHLANNGYSWEQVIDQYFPDFGHVQIADSPGRHQPGTGIIPFARSSRRWKPRAMKDASDSSTGHRAQLNTASSDCRARREKRKEPPRDHHRIHRARHHGTADVGQPRPGRLHSGWLQPPPESATDLVAAGGTAAPGIGPAVAAADVVVLMLPDSPDVQQVVTDEDGVLAHARPGTLLIDMSTIAPQAKIAITQAAAQAGLRAIDAPV